MKKCVFSIGEYVTMIPASRNWVFTNKPGEAPEYKRKKTWKLKCKSTITNLDEPIDQ